MAVTCHYVTEEAKLSTVLLGLRKFPDTHTAANIAEAKSALMTDWGITGKVTSLVTDCASNMIPCANLLHLHHHFKSCGEAIPCSNP